MNVRMPLEALRKRMREWVEDVPGETIDRLRDIAGELLRQSPEYPLLMSEMSAAGG